MTDPRTPRTEAGRLAFDDCPTCSDPSLVRLPADWQAQVGNSALIPIVGCGNPWHYVGIEAQASPLGSSERLAAAVHAAMEWHICVEAPAGAGYVRRPCIVMAERILASIDPDALSDPDAERQRAIGEDRAVRLLHAIREALDVFDAGRGGFDAVLRAALRHDERTRGDPMVEQFRA
jgi:hypothetical protein